MGNALLLIHKIVSQPPHCFDKSQKTITQRGEEKPTQCYEKVAERVLHNFCQ